MNVPDVDRTMPGRGLVAYATRGGSTRAAAEAVAAELRARGLEVSLTPAAEVRGLGLLLAVELADGLDAREIAALLLRRGVVVNAVTPSALRLAPSLLISDDEVRLAVAAIAGAVDEAASGSH